VLLEAEVARLSQASSDAAELTLLRAEHDRVVVENQRLVAELAQLRACGEHGQGTP